MPVKPPPLPERVYQRVLRVSKIEGLSILYISGFCALFSAAGGSVVGAIVGCLVAGTGALEVHASQQLARGDERGIHLLVRAQLLLMVVILAYVCWQLTHFDEAFVRSLIPEVRKTAGSWFTNSGMPNPYDAYSDTELVQKYKLGRTIAYLVVALGTCIYQGLMARYYHNKRAAIAQALDNLES